MFDDGVFRVPAGFYSLGCVLALGQSDDALAALGLYVLAGAWSAHHETDGVVPMVVLGWLTKDADKLRKMLVASGLWSQQGKEVTFLDIITDHVDFT